MSHYLVGDCTYPETNGPAVQHGKPVVVIDPEDREAVERLASLMRVRIETVLRASVDDRALTRLSRHLKAALLEFANPKPPKPEEPTGFLAEVEDAAGDHWFRIFERGMCPWVRRVSNDTNGAHLDVLAGGEYDSESWVSIDVVRVLSEGVQP